MWDIRTKQEIHVLTGHSDTVSSIITNPVDPQIITGSHDSTIKVHRLYTLLFLKFSIILYFNILSSGI